MRLHPRHLAPPIVLSIVATLIVTSVGATDRPAVPVVLAQGDSSPGTGADAAPGFWMRRSDARGEAVPRRAAAEDRVSRGSIIGPDDRRRVNPTTGFPWRAVVSLEVTFDNGASFVVCSGAFIGPTVVVTAGHCLFDPQSTLGWATDVVVVPGRNDVAEPYGYQFASDILVPSGYVSSGAAALDIGIVVLPNDQLTSQTSRFRYTGSSGAGLVGTAANLAGYPGENYTQQWFHAGPIADRSYAAASDTGILSYPMDTTGGQSGSPIWAFNGTDRFIVGVHTRGESSVFCSNAGGANNCGTLITGMLAAQLEAGGADTRSVLSGSSLPESLPGTVPPVTLTPTHTAVPTATIPTSGSVGGRGFGIEPALGGNILSWQDGTVETGYLLARLNGPSLTVLPPGGPLPGNATSYFDGPLPPGLSCYFGAAIGGITGDAIGVTDLLCAAPSIRSATRAPQSFTLRLNQSSMASLSWAPPLQGGYDGFMIAPLGGIPTLLPANATTVSIPLTGPTCFLLFAMQSGVPVGNTDAVCGLPGVSTLGG